MGDIYFNFNLILYVVMRSRSYIGMLDCAILTEEINIIIIIIIINLHFFEG